jgi:hypothetical protein
MPHWRVIGSTDKPISPISVDGASMLTTRMEESREGV